MRSRISLFFTGIVFVVLYLSPVTSFGQLGTGVKIDSLKPKSTPIPVVNIIRNIEVANEEIKDTQRRLKSKKNIILIDSNFPAYAIFIQAQKKRGEQFIEANPNRQKINNLIKKWNGYGDNLNSWESDINSYVTKNTILSELVAEKEKTWELTYQNAKEHKVPLEVLNNVKVVWDDFRKINKQIVTENNKFLLLESKINNQKLTVNKIVDELTDLKNSEVYDLFYLRHQPLWKTSFKTDKKDEDERIKVESIPENLSGINNFIQTNENSLSLFVLIIASIVFLMLFLKKTFQKFPFNEEDGNLQSAKDIILNHNLEGIIFLCLVAANFFFTNVPMLFSNLLIFLILIVAVPLVKPYMYKRFKNIIYFVLIFFILDSAKTYLWFSSPQYRLYLLFEAIFVAAVIYKFTHPYIETRKMNIGKFGLLLIKMAPVIYGLLLVSVISNILGYTNLTDLTLKIGTQSGVFTLIFYGMIMLIGGIFIGLTHHYFSTREPYDMNQKLTFELKILQVIRVLGFIWWLFFFLGMIDLLGPVQQFFTDLFSEPHIIGTITFTIGDVLMFIIILVVSFTFTSLISFIFDSGQVTSKFIKLPKGVPAAISLVIRYLVIAFGIVLALSSLGVDLGKFNLMAGALGLGIGFGLQTVVSNFISGLILVFERPIHIGDTVEVNNLLGNVSRIGVRSSSIKTFDGAEVVVPNNNLIANDLINWTLSDSIKRVEILIGTTYGSDPNKVLEILMGEVKKNKNALKNPEPNALFSEFGESSLNFKLRFWVNFEVALSTKSNISIGIYNEFAKHGIEIPFPQRDIHIKNMPAKLDGDDIIK
jgi:small-conductance mechanosensitive channel